MLSAAQRNHFALALRMLKRDWQSGHLNVLAMALLVAVSTHATIGVICERIRNSMQVQTSALSTLRNTSPPSVTYSHPRRM